MFYYENEKWFLAPIAVKTSLSNSMFLDCKIVWIKTWIAGGKFYGFKEVPF
jgi:hypothetical protein